MEKTVIVGIDGVPFALLDSLSERGVMPYFKRLKEEGTFTKMRSSVPEVSSVSWSSIVTGKNPGEHAVYGFTGLLEGSYTLTFPHSGRLKAPPFWKREGRFVVINVPSTYPASPLSGILIAGFISPDLERAVYPPEYVEVLKTLNYKVDVDTKRAQKSYSLLFQELNESHDARVKTYRYFWDFDWDLFMVVFTGSDRLEHFLWDAYEDEGHAYHSHFLEYFTRIDEAIGDIDQRLDRRCSLILLSDHGMEKVRADVNVNAFLEEKGFLKRGRDPRLSYNNIKEGTKAFALDPGRIYVNTHRYPRGSVEKGEEEEVRRALKEAFEAFEKEGEKVIKNVYAREEIYHGPYLDAAPDLVLVPERGFNLKGGILPENVFGRDMLSGKHNGEAFLYVKGDTPIPMDPSVEDVVSLLRW